MKKDYRRVIALAQAHPWAVAPSKLAQIAAFLAYKSQGGSYDEDEVRALVGDRRHPEMFAGPGERQRARYAEQVTVRNGVAIMPVYGLLMQHMSAMGDVSEPLNASMDTIGETFGALVADAQVHTIVLNIDSPGGQIRGVQELWDRIMAARGVKDVVAVANGMAASAAYWIMSAAKETYVTPSGEIGSIGVYSLHEDISRQLEQEGINVTVISAGKYKTEGLPFAPLSDDARAYAQQRVNESYDSFVRAVAKGRGTTPAAVRKGFGEGRSVSASTAKAQGMVDSIATLEQVLAAKMKKRGGRGWAGATAEPAAMAAVVPDDGLVHAEACDMGEDCNCEAPPVAAPEQVAQVVETVETTTTVTETVVVETITETVAVAEESADDAVAREQDDLRMRLALRNMGVHMDPINP